MPPSITYEPIICTNTPTDIVKKIQSYLEKNKIIKDICVLDENDNQVVLLIDKEPINHELATVWWDGYSTGLRTALE